MAGIRRSSGNARPRRAKPLATALSVAVVGSLAFASQASAVAQSFTATLVGSQETAPTGSTATGTGTVALDAAETSITVNASFSGLTTNAVAGHIHAHNPPAPAPPGTNANVRFGFTGVPAATSGSIPTQVFAVTPAEVVMLRTGQWYFNIHSAMFPGGEIRGQIVTSVSKPGVVAKGVNYAFGDSLTEPVPISTLTFGLAPNVPFVCDLDGNGSETPVSYEAGSFKVSDSYAGGTPDRVIAFGDPKGFPLGGDFDGDARDDLAVYRNGTWQVRYTDDGATDSLAFGSGQWPDTIPVTGDWDGNGIDGIGTYTRSTATWNLRSTATASGVNVGSFVFGTPTTSYPVVGDWNLDNRETIGAKTGTQWTIRNANNAGIADGTFFFGAATNHPFTWRGP